MRTFQRILLAVFLGIYALSLFGCYGAAIDTRDIEADEVTITTNTPWSNTTITAKGWRSKVKAQSEENK